MSSLILALFSIVLLLACTPTGQRDTESGLASVIPESINPAAAPDGIAPVPSSLPAVVARVNGVDIERIELEQAIDRIQAQVGGSLPDSERSHIIREVLDQLIAYSLLTQEAVARGITVVEAELSFEIAQIQAQFPSEEAFALALAQQQTTPARFRADTERQLLIRQLLEEEITSQVTITSQQVLSFYQENPDQFRQDAQVRASHILVAFPDDADDADRLNVRVQAEQILDDINSGADFAALALELSDDSNSGSIGGDLGFFGKGAMVPPFEEAAFALQPGETSTLVETQFGYHIIRVIDRRAPQMLPLEDVRTQIEQFLQGRNEQDNTQRFIDTLRTQGTVTVLI
jgi:peptidyl-prolyl cis-trans isomerase C